MAKESGAERLKIKYIKEFAHGRKQLCDAIIYCR